MTIYDLVFEKIQEKYENGEYTIEEAEMLNDLAYDRYMSEGKNIDAALNNMKTGYETDKKYVKNLIKVVDDYHQEYKEIKKGFKKMPKAEVITKVTLLKTKLKAIEAEINKCPENLSSEALGLVGSYFAGKFGGAVKGAITGLCIGGAATGAVIGTQLLQGNADKTDAAFNGIIGGIGSAELALTGGIIGACVGPFLTVGKNVIKYKTVNEFKASAKKAVDTEIKNCDILLSKAKSMK